MPEAFLGYCCEKSGRLSSGAIPTASSTGRENTRPRPETRRYMGLLGKINREMAKQAGEVWEVTCGVPICHKGGTR